MYHLYSISNAMFYYGITILCNYAYSSSSSRVIRLGRSYLRSFMRNCIHWLCIALESSVVNFISNCYVTMYWIWGLVIIICGCVLYRWCECGGMYDVFSVRSYCVPSKLLVFLNSNYSNYLQVRILLYW